MNNLNEIIDVKKAACRQFDVNELMSLLRANITMFWSWGAHAFTADKERTLFRMKVNGHHHKGHVYIFLSGSDLFDVYLTSVRGTIQKKIEGLYFDQLAEWIDENVEKIAAYMN